MKTFSMPPELVAGEAVPCNFCGTWNSKVYLRCEGFVYVKCGRCGLVYQNPRPGRERIHVRYGEDYFKYEVDNEKTFFHLMKLSLEDIDIASIEEELTAKKTFLDVGCATGMLLDYMKNRDWQTEGVEVCHPAVEYGRKVRGLSIFSGTLKEASFPDRSFNVVHCSHLIEHLPDPKMFIREVSRIMAPFGYFIVTTPNIGGFQGKIKKSRWRSAIPDHLYLMSRKTLKAYLKEAGFTIVKGKTWGGIPKGEAPLGLKRIFDYTAKRFGFGDVMIYLAKMERKR